jgi:hypothetical protein
MTIQSIKKVRNIYLFKLKFDQLLLDIQEDLLTQLTQLGLTMESIPY